MELTKENLYTEIQRYAYDNQFSNLKVFSKQYYHSVVLPCYEDNSKSAPYSIISIDFNDMQEINKYGMKKGDKILYDSIELMQSTLPKSSYTVRMGGDEFLFVLPNTSKQEAMQYEYELNETLLQSSKKIRGTTVTSYCVSAEEAKDLSTLVEIADAGINNIKQTAKKIHSVDNWEILQNKINENFSTFFKTLRFHNFPMETKHIQNILLDVITSYDTFMSEENTPQADTKEDNYSDNMHKKYSFNNVQELHNLFVNNRFSTPTKSDLDSLDIGDIVNLLNYLVRDPLTMQFNKPYLINHLLNDRNLSLKALRVSSAFVKVSNTLNNSHSYTDKQIEKCGNDIYSFLNEKIDFNQDAFTNLPINYMVTLDGGDMLLALNPDTDLDAEDIHDFLNSSNLNSYSKDNLLRLVVADKFQTINKHNFDKVLLKQSKECNKNKIPLISQILDDDILNELLNVTLRDTMEFYKTIIPDSKDISAKTKFIDLVSKAILDLHSSLDVTHDDEKKKNPFSKFLGSITSKFKKKPLALPEPTTENQEIDKKTDTSASFVPKFEIDYSKIKYPNSFGKSNYKDRDEK